MYSSIYNSRQHAPRYVPRQWYHDDAMSLPWVRHISIKRSDQLNRQSVRGLIFSHDKQSHGGFDNYEYTIVLAQGLTIEYERFVTIKELMHCYFPPIDGHVKYMTGSAMALEAHLNAFFGNATSNPAQAQAERIALWMALGVICTEDDRQGFLQQFAASEITAEAIGGEMCIPTKQARNLLSTNYDTEIQKLIS